MKIATAPNATQIARTPQVKDDVAPLAQESKDSFDWSGAAKAGLAFGAVAGVSSALGAHFGLAGVAGASVAGTAGLYASSDSMNVGRFASSLGGGLLAGVLAGVGAVGGVWGVALATTAGAGVGVMGVLRR